MGQVQSSEFMRHGGRIADAARAWPAAPGPWLDLSTGINPRPWAPATPPAVDSGPLPDPAALRHLEAAAARHFGADPARVVAVPGSELGLRLLPALGLPRPIVALRPGYGTHADVADTAVDTIPPGGEDTLLLANPNNPDGRLRDPGGLPRDRWLVVDEAFADCHPASSLCPQVDDAARLVVLRSFGKFFGLAGLRLGFVVAPRPIAARLRALLGDWPVGSQAIAWGIAAYGDDDWIAATRGRLAADAAALDAVLQRHGLPAAGACPLFRLVKHKDAAGIFERLAAQAILTRPFAAQPEWLRFGLPGDTATLDRLDRALAGG